MAPSAYGYSAANPSAMGGAIEAVGTLDPSTFTYASVSYTVQRLFVSTADVIAVFQTSPALPNNARLKLRLPTFRTTTVGTCAVGGTHDFDLNASSAHASVTGRYEWDVSSATICVNAAHWASNLSTTGTVKLIEPAAGGTPTVSTDATLSGGTVKAGSTTLVTFASGTATYTASVANGVEEVTFAPTTNHASATVDYFLGDDGDEDELEDADDMEDGFQVPLAVGANRIDVFVTAEDGTTTLSHIVTVTRAAAPMTPTCTLNTAAGDLWCGVVTVGAIMISGTHFADGFNSSTGGLSDTTFTVGTNNYTIDTIGVGATVAAGSLNFSLTSALTATDRAKLVLHVGSRSFALSDSGDPGASFSYDWPTAGLDWSSETSVTLRLRANSAPVFADDLVALTLPENSAVGTSVGAAVTATDADSDTLTYSLEGTDAASFDIESGTGQIKTKSGVTYDLRGDAEHLRDDGEGRRRQRRHRHHRSEHRPVGRRREIRQAGQAQAGEGDGLVDEPDRDLDEAGAQRRPGHHRLRPAVPGGAGRHVDGLRAHRHGGHHDRHRADGGHVPIRCRCGRRTARPRATGPTPPTRSAPTRRATPAPTTTSTSCGEWTRRKAASRSATAASGARSATTVLTTRAPRRLPKAGRSPGWCAASLAMPPEPRRIVRTSAISFP